RVLELGELVAASDEAREAARYRYVEARAQRARPPQGMYPQRRADAFDFELAEVAQLKISPHERRRRRREVCASRLGERLHALREADCVADGGVGERPRVAERADHDLARVEPHAHAEAEPTLAPQLGRIGVELIAQMKR